MSCDVAQGEGPEPITGLCGEAAGESRLSSLSPPSESFIQPAAPSFVAELLWPQGVDEEAKEGFQMNWGACGCACSSFMMAVLSLTLFFFFFKFWLRLVYRQPLSVMHVEI